MTFLSPKTHTYIHIPTKWGYTKSLHKIKQEHYIIHPRHSGETKLGRYMTLIRKEIHDIEMKYLQPDYDSYQQLSSTAPVNHHSDQQPCSPSILVPRETKTL